ncbi:hypothetical protein Pcinc_026748 [Petrolisthes cinctipes]|uniref:Reverse transcriptase domain-containing protein n=1 Tax=Petrolisthes cinctipes TaxID=88211 RepID=A0AAE1F5X9_PETCI|nr:hypothetical protein Pcinc_026748 [Petrolisthes cinctipes]
MKLSIDIDWKRKLANKMQSIEKQLILSHENGRKYAEMKAVEAVKRNPKFFYKYVKEKAKIRSPIGPLKLDGELVDDTERICAALRSQYDSVFSKPISYDVLCDTELDEVHHDMTDVNFTEKNIAEAVAELACGAAAGPDGIPAILLKKCAKTLSVPLYILWRTSLTDGLVPPALKLGYITPIYKGGDRCLAQNYRPITLTSHVIKIFEKILVKKLMAYMDKHSLFNDGQHGFRPGRSCVSQLMQHYQEIIKALENGSGVDVVYLDFSKAFDKMTLDY